MVGMTMKNLLCWTLTTAILTHVSATEELNEESWRQLIGSRKNGMIKFYQPWCGHCTRMKPDWDKLAENVDSSVFIADVNCSDEEDLCKRNEISGYPTIKIYRDGVDEKYHGGRGYDELLDYVNENLARKCDIAKPESCSDKAYKYIKKWKQRSTEEVKTEITRLQGMAGRAMTNDLKAWLSERVSILVQMDTAAAAKS